MLYGTYDGLEGCVVPSMAPATGSDTQKPTTGTGIVKNVCPSLRNSTSDREVELAPSSAHLFHHTWNVHGGRQCQHALVRDEVDDRNVKVVGSKIVHEGAIFVDDATEC